MEKRQHMIMGLDKVINMCLIIRLSRKKTRVCSMHISSGDKIFKTFGS